mgnify:CR=1 FL=1
MLDKYQRAAVESIKEADTLKLTIGGGIYDEYGDLTLSFIAKRNDIRKLRHDIALAVQDYMMKENKRLWKQNFSGSSASSTR